MEALLIIITIFFGLTSFQYVLIQRRLDTLFKRKETILKELDRLERHSNYLKGVFHDVAAQCERRLKTEFKGMNDRIDAQRQSANSFLSRFQINQEKWETALSKMIDDYSKHIEHQFKIAFNKTELFQLRWNKPEKKPTKKPIKKKAKK